MFVFPHRVHTNLRIIWYYYRSQTEDWGKSVWYIYPGTDPSSRVRPIIWQHFKKGIKKGITWDDYFSE